MSPRQPLRLWDMLHLPLGRLILSHQKIAVLGQVFAVRASAQGSVSIDDAGYRDLVANADEFRDLCLELGFSVTHGAAIRVCEDVRRATSKLAHWHFDSSAVLHCDTALNQMWGCLRNESANMAALMLHGDAIAYFEPKTPLFGNDVSAKFPSIAYDISESGKCLALGRSTASAFHSVRCLEAGFAAIWRCVGVPDPLSGFERNWSNRLRKVSEQLEARWPAKSGRMSGDAKFFDEVVGAISAMQNPYRNSTMHLDSVYTEDDARMVFNLVRGLIQKIASRMDENGLPLA